MVGVYGVASRLFGCLEKAKINVVLIAQASSEHSICFAIPMDRLTDAQESIQLTFFREFHQHDIESISAIVPVSIIAAVGDNMSRQPGVSAQFFNAFRQSRINILAISQGSSERNISVVVHSRECSSALRAAHSAFYLSPQTISIGLIVDAASWGLVENQDETIVTHLMNQIQHQHAWLLDRYRVHLQIRAMGCLPHDRFRLYPGTGISLESLDSQDVQHFGTRANSLEEFVAHITAPHLPHWLILDCSCGLEVVSKYRFFFQHQLNVISLNPYAGSCDLGLQFDIDQARCHARVFYSLEPAVGPGLPMLHMLTNCISTGDPVYKVELLLSPLVNATICEGALASLEECEFDLEDWAGKPCICEYL